MKQKVLAAHRATIARVILPSANELDAVELPDDVKVFFLPLFLTL